MQSDVVSYIFPHVDPGSLLKATVKGTEVKSQVCRWEGDEGLQQVSLKLVFVNKFGVILPG